MTTAHTYERLLERARTARGAPPRASASVVPWRRTACGRLEVFWVERSPALAFMGGWHAFPGGALSRSDRDVPVEEGPRGLDPGQWTAPEPGTGEEVGPDLVPGLVACALRELFEETGLLLATRLAGGSLSAEPRRDLGRARRRLLARESRFAELAAEHGWRLTAARLLFAGRWRTPPLGPLRFDNRFFLLEWSDEEELQPEVLPGELTAGEWVAPGDAVERWRRGEVMAAPPILHTLEVLAEAGPEAGLERLRRPQGVDLGPFLRIELRPGVVLLPLRTPTLPPATHTNAYLLGRGQAVLVDPGSPLPEEIERLERAVAAARLLGRRVEAIWLTHHHADHVGGVGAMRRALGVPVLAHRLTVERLRERGVAVDGELRDDERIVLDGEPSMAIRVLHTPGHASGHLAFLEEEHRSLLTGDLVAGIGTVVVDPPDGDMDAYLRSLERLRELRPATLFPAHGPVVLQAAEKLAEYRDHRLERERRVLAAWRAGRREPREMLDEVYDDDLPPAARPLAERQIVAHLERLERRGEL